MGTTNSQSIRPLPGREDTRSTSFCWNFPKFLTKTLINDLSTNNLEVLGQRAPQVFLGGSCSWQAGVVSGVPHGTILPPPPLPTIYGLYQWPAWCCQPLRSRLLADGYLLYRLVRTDDDARRMQEDLDALEEWERRWQMKFHTEKCQVIKINLNSNSSTVSDAISTSSRYIDAKEPVGSWG